MKTKYGSSSQRNHHRSNKICKITRKNFMIFSDLGFVIFFIFQHCDNIWHAGCKIITVFKLNDIYPKILVFSTLSTINCYRWWGKHGNSYQLVLCCKRKGLKVLLNRFIYQSKIIITVSWETLMVHTAIHTIIKSIRLWPQSSPLS